MKHYSANHGNCNGGLNWRLLFCTISLALLFARGAGAQSASYNVSASGTFDVQDWNFLNGSLPPNDGAVKNYSATTAASAVADGTLVHSTTAGIKLTYTSAGTTGFHHVPNGHFTPGTVRSTATAFGPLGSTSSGEIDISGAHITGIPSINRATVSGTAVINPALGGYATFSATAKDPYPFQMSDQSPFPEGTQLGFSLTLPAAGNSLPAGNSLFSWSVAYASYIAPINTSDVDTFYAANPDLLYSLTLSGGPNGYAVNFVPGSPSGFPVTFSETPSQIGADVLAALQSSLSSDLTAVSGEVDVSGNTSASIGAEGDIYLEASAPVPEPASLVAWAGLGAMGLIACVWRRRRAMVSRPPLQGLAIRRSWPKIVVAG